MTITYRALPDLLWEQFDDELVVFNAAAGQTHLLTAAAAPAFLAVAAAPRGLEELLAELGTPAAPAIESEYRELFAQLEELGLVVAA